MFFLYAGCLITTLGGMEIATGFVALLFFIGFTSKYIFADYQLAKSVFTSWPMRISYIFIFVVIMSLVLSPIGAESGKQIFDGFGFNRNLIFMAMMAALWRPDFTSMSSPFIRWISSIILIVCLYSFLQHFTGIDLIRTNNKNIALVGSTYLSAGLFSLTLTYAYCLGALFFFLMPVAVSEGFRSRDSLTKVLLGVTVIIMPFSLLTSGARGAWVAFAICFLIALPTCIPAKYIRKVYLPILATIVGYFLINRAYFERLLSIFSTDYSSNYSRIKIWQAHFEVFKDYPILGAGFLLNDKIVARYYEKLGLQVSDNLSPTHHAHNDYIELLAGTGLLGATLYIALWALMIFMAAAGARKLKGRFPLQSSLMWGCFLAQLFLAIGSLTQCNYFDREVVHVLTFIWAAVLALGYEYNFLLPRKA